MKYEDGFYHVILNLTGESSIAQIANGKWWVIGCEDSFLESDFSAIGPRVVIPESVK